MAEITSTDNKKVQLEHPMVLEARNMPGVTLTVNQGEYIDLTTTVYEAPREKTTIIKWWTIREGVVYQRTRSFTERH